MSSLRRTVVPLTLGLGLGLLALLLVARFGTWRAPWPIPVLDTFALYAFAPFVAVAVVGNLARSRALAVLTLAALLFFGQQFGAEIVGELGLTSPATASATVAPPRLRVLTVNLQARYAEVQWLLPLIQEHRPDLLVLQEVTTRYADELNQTIGEEYPYWFAAGTDTEHEGTGTWSRLPLAEAESFRLSTWGNELHRVRVSTERGGVWVYNVHLPNPTDPENDDVDRGRLAAARAYDESRRDAELDALVEQVSGLGAPAIVAGDFNLSAGTRAYRRLPSDWRDAFAATGRGFGHTFPTPEHDHEGDEPRWFKLWFSLLRIDYVFATGGLVPTAAWTDLVFESDHLAVLADIETSAAR